MVFKKIFKDVMSLNKNPTNGPGLLPWDQSTSKNTDTARSASQTHSIMFVRESLDMLLIPHNITTFSSNGETDRFMACQSTFSNGLLQFQNLMYSFGHTT